MPRYQWSALIPRCVEVLRRHDNVESALAEIRASGIHPTATAPNMADAFRRGGHHSPSSFLKHMSPDPYVGSGVSSFEAQTRRAEKRNAYPPARGPTFSDLSSELATGRGVRNETAYNAPPRQGLTRILVCPDAHHPFADQLAWRTFLAAAREWRPDRMVIIGDFADCISVSFHPKDPSRRLGLKDEMAAVNAAADEIEALRIPTVDFLCGNHCYRIQRYLWEKAPELYGLIEVSELLRIKERGWNWVPYRESLQIGKIHFAHDVGRCGKYTASQSLADYGHSIVIGHSHRAATFYGGTVRGDRQVAMNVGTLIDIDSVDYRHKAMAAREWQHGFGVVHMTDDGLGWCNFVPIIDGRCVVDGRVISGRG